MQTNTALGDKCPFYTLIFVLFYVRLIMRIPFLVLLFLFNFFFSVGQKQMHSYFKICTVFSFATIGMAGQARLSFGP